MKKNQINSESTRIVILGILNLNIYIYKFNLSLLNIYIQV